MFHLANNPFGTLFQGHHELGSLDDEAAWPSNDWRLMCSISLAVPIKHRNPKAQLPRCWNVILLY